MEYGTIDHLGLDLQVFGNSSQQSEFSNPEFTAISADISSAQGANRLVDQVVNKFARLDILAHTVGGFAGGQSVADIDDKTFQQMLEMNLNATFYLVRAAIPVRRKVGDGRIVAIGSRAALEPGAGVDLSCGLACACSARARSSSCCASFR